MEITKDLYNILDAASDASDEELKSCYRRLARKYHPDSGSTADDAMFQLVQSAWDVLGDPDKRAEYNKSCSKDNWDSIRDDKLAKFQQRSATIHNFGHAEPLADNWTSPTVKEPSNHDSAQESAPTSVLSRLKTIANNKISEQIKVAENKSNTISNEQNLSIKISPLDVWFGSSKELEINSLIGKRKIRVKIPKGISSGTYLKVNCKDNVQFPAQNVKILVEVQNRSDIKLDGQDIIILLPISYSEVILGEEVVIRTPEGKVKIKIPANFELGKMIRVNHAGVELSLNKGNLYIKPTLANLADSSSLRKILAKLDELYKGDIRAKLLQELESKELE